MPRTQDILGKLFAGPLRDLFEKLSGKDGEKWLLEFEKFLRKEPCWINVAKGAEKVISDLFQWLSPITIAPTSDKFVIGEIINDRNTDVPICFVSSNFESWFSKIVENQDDKVELCRATLRKAANDQEILAEFGGENAVETTIVAIYSLVTKQAKGQKGVLLVDGHANIFYARDSEGVLRAVGVYWSGSGWNFDADHVEDPRRWGKDDQVFFRNS